MDLSRARFCREIAADYRGRSHECAGRGAAALRETFLARSDAWDALALRLANAARGVVGSVTLDDVRNARLYASGCLERAYGSRAERLRAEATDFLAFLLECAGGSVENVEGVTHA